MLRKIVDHKGSKLEFSLDHSLERGSMRNTLSMTCKNDSKIVLHETLSFMEGDKEILKEVKRFEEDAIKQFNHTGPISVFDQLKDNGYS